MSKYFSGSCYPKKRLLNNDTQRENERELDHEKSDGRQAGEAD